MNETSTGSDDTHRSRYLVLDSRVVERTSNAALVLGSVQKHAGNPLFVEDYAWEARFDNLYGNILYDAEEALYKCWYSPFIVANSAKGMTVPERQAAPFEGRKDQEMGICYATSKDGLHWEKPELGQVEFDGSTANNLVWRGPHGAGIFRDDHETDPQRRYKTIFQGIKVSFSPDGLDWSEAIRLETGKIAGDTHNNALWVPELDRYVAFTRTWGQSDREIIGEENKTNHRWVRQVARMESTDFIHWSPVEVVLEGADWQVQPYAMPVFKHGGVYLGLIAFHDQVTDRVWTELAWSPDTADWRRIAPGTAFIDCADTEMDYDFGCVYACASPLVKDDEIWIYYGGSDGYHFGWRNGCLALATLRPDGYAGFAQEDASAPATVQTVALPYHGQAIKISADVEAGGSVSARLVSEAGTVLASGQLQETASDALVIAGQASEQHSVHLEFELRGAKLYSFLLEDASAP